MVDIIFRYFPGLSNHQKEQFSMLKNLYEDWNNKINVISRKDMENFYVHHVLHSLSIAKFADIAVNTKILDVGTGGGFPGIPLAIIFPASNFTLLDSIAKKIRVVSSVSAGIGLKNVKTLWKRIEEEKGRYDFIISRAVSEFSEFVRLSGKNIDNSRKNRIGNGILYLKGGDLTEELAPFKNRIVIKDISEYFSEPFFVTKKIVYLPF